MTRKYSAALAAAALAFALSACGEPGASSTLASTSPTTPSASSVVQQQSESASSTASGLPATADKKFQVRIALDNSVPPSLFAGIYAAQEEGYFSAEGLDVEAALYTATGTPALEKAADGTAQLAVTAQAGGMVSALADAKPVTAVAALQQHNDAGLLSIDSNHVQRPRALEGKSCTTDGSPLQQALFRTALTADGGDTTKVTLNTSAQSGIDWAVQALQSNAPAVSASYGWDGLLCKEKGLSVNFQFYADISSQLDGYPALLAVNNTFLNAHGAQVKAFLRAAWRGYTYAAQYPDTAAALVTQRIPSLSQDQSGIQRSLTWLAGKYRDDAPYWGAIDQTRWNAFYTWFNTQKLSAKSVPLGTGFSNEYLPQQTTAS